jgi:hypothetical protein
MQHVGWFAIWRRQQVSCLFTCQSCARLLQGCRPQEATRRPMLACHETPVLWPARVVRLRIALRARSCMQSPS